MRYILPAALAAFAIDQVSKVMVIRGLNLADSGPIDIAAPFLRFAMGWNRGINFGIFASHAELARWFLVALAIVISGALHVWASRRKDAWLQTGAGMVIGGALGNALDRVRFGAVADFLNMSCCGISNPYIFNLADVTIFAGAALIMLKGGGERKHAS